jgi:SfnB family sulfur acquisition oxidoreductase
MFNLNASEKKPMSSTGVENLVQPSRSLDSLKLPSAHRLRSDQEAIQTAQQIARELEAEASVRDRERRLPHAEIELLTRNGLWGITIPKAFGGPGVSHSTLVEVFAILAAADPSLGQIPHNHFCVIDAIRLDGTEEQKRFYFEQVLAGKRFGNAFSEAGTKNVMDFQTRITPDGDAFRVNGKKFYSTGAFFAHIIPTAAVNEEKKGLLVLIPRDTPGLTVVDDWDGFGQRTTASGSVLLDNVRVESDWIIPAYQASDRPTLTGPLSQIIQAAIDAGIARTAVRETIEFVRTKARPWIDSKVEKASEDPLTISQVGDLEIRLHAAEALLQRAARFLDEAEEIPAETTVAKVSTTVAEAKVVTTEIAILATNKLFELAGTQSTLGKYNLDRHWRNARTHTLHDPVRWKYYAIGNYYLNNVNPPRHPWN